MTKIVDWFVLIVTALLPLYVIRFKVFGIPVTFLEILILVLFSIWLLERGLKTKNLTEFFDSGDFFYPILFLIAVAVISTAFSFDQNGGLGILKAFFFEPVLLFLVILERVKAGSGKYPFLGLILATTWLASLAIFQKVTGTGFPDYAKSEITQGRVVAVYNSANSLALFLGPVFALSLGWIFSNLKSLKNPFVVIFATFSLFLQGLVMILTKSQAGIFATGVICIFILMSKIFPFKKLITIFNSVLILAIFLTFFLPILAFLKVNFGAAFSDETLQNRFYLWEATSALILDRPLLGAGLDGFKELYAVNYKLPVYDELLQYPHNLVLTFWAELGVLGVIAIFWLLFKLVIKSVKNKYLGIGLMAAVLYILIHGIVDVPYFKNDLSAQFFILLALSKLNGYISPAGSDLRRNSSFLI